MSFKIQVQDRRNGNWRDRTVVSEDRKGNPLTDQNDALRAYGVSGTRPRLGEATSKSGKRFRAVPIKAEPAKRSGSRRGNARRSK